MKIKRRAIPCGNRHASAPADKKYRADRLKPICWIIIPVIMITLLILDGLGVYTFNVERLIVLGIGLLVVLLPFFSEITIKDVSIKRGEENSHPSS